MTDTNTPSKTFCILPWMHIFADTRGVMYPCCRGPNVATPNVDTAGKPYRLYEIDILDEAWNSDFMKDIRTKMLAGQRPEACMTCYAYEDWGIPSPRLMWNRLYQHHVDVAVANTDDDGSAEMIIRSWDIHMGNVCNLRCRMCGPHASKGLIKEWVELYSVPEDDPELLELRQLNWFDSDDFWQSFERFSPYIDRLHFAGGEPLMNSKMFDFLERLVTMGQAADITLSYNTNLSILPDRIFDLWPEFKRVIVTVSVDGYNEINSFIRSPSDWQTLDRHVRLLDAEADHLKCSLLVFNATVQVYNIFHLEQLFEYTTSGFQRFRPYPNLTPLEHPACFSIQILPQDLKMEAKERLEGFKQRFAKRPDPPSAKPDDRAHFLKNLNGVIEHMMQADQQQQIPEFVRQSDILDRHRQEHACEVIPELAPLFSGRAES